MGSSVVTRKGQITIPAEIRREMNIEVGDRVIFLRTAGGVEIVTPEEWVRRTAGSLPLPEGVKPLTIDEEKEAMQQAIAEDVMARMSQS